MSFLYPRTIAISRPPATLSNGTQPGYNGVSAASETPIVSGLPASIQESATSGATSAGLPSDARTSVYWRILIPKRACSVPDAIKNKDSVTDDLGRRFQVIAAYYNSLGFNLRVEQLEV